MWSSIKIPLCVYQSSDQRLLVPGKILTPVLRILMGKITRQLRKCFMISISCAGKKFINFLILRSMVKNNFAPGQRDGVLGSTLTCKYLSSEAFLRKSEESRPPRNWLSGSKCTFMFTRVKNFHNTATQRGFWPKVKKVDPP